MSEIVRMIAVNADLWVDDANNVITQIWVTREQFELIVKTYKLVAKRGAPTDIAEMGLVIFCVHVTPEELGLI